MIRTNVLDDWHNCAK